MDPPNISLLKIKPKPKSVITRRGVPLKDIERASVKSKIMDALGKYQSLNAQRSTIAQYMLSRPETLYLHPPTIAGAIFLLELSKQKEVKYDKIFTFRDLDSEIKEVLDKIILTNISGTQLINTRLRTKADLIRYMIFIVRIVEYKI
uniref:Uncharacterized protein n=1 Tax=Pithovirus LCPAC202 TaxID=2506592 RepID=A0A481Z8Q5_9VIRU|nr:MAG: hypothetical protein LCPAC202_00350 [Pithovirus LCPAC202]